MPWRTVDGTAIAPRSVRRSFETVVEGRLREESRFLALARDFTVFGDTGSGIAKILAGYHQFHAVLRAVESTVLRIASDWPPRCAGRITGRVPSCPTRRRAASGRQAHRRHLAHPGLGQEPAHGVLCRTDHCPPGDGESDRGRRHRPQRPRRSAVRRVLDVPRPVATDARNTRTAATELQNCF